MSDYDREEWLYHKIEKPIDSDPHSKESREQILTYLEKNVHDKRSLRRCFCYYISCCGTLLRFYNTSIDKMWIVLGMCYVNIWFFFFYNHLGKSFMGEVNETRQEIWEAFGKSVLGTFLFTVIGFIIYEIPRVWNQCYKIRCCTTRRGKRAYCLIESNTIYRQRRKRLSNCVAKDVYHDDEARTYTWLYDSDLDEDEYIYYNHNNPQNNRPWLCKHFCKQGIKRMNEITAFCSETNRKHKKSAKTTSYQKRGAHNNNC